MERPETPLIYRPVCLGLAAVARRLLPTCPFASLAQRLIFLRHPWASLRFDSPAVNGSTILPPRCRASPRHRSLTRPDSKKAEPPNHQRPRFVFASNGCGGGIRLSHHHPCTKILLKFEILGKNRWPYGYDVLRQFRYPDYYPFPTEQVIIPQNQAV